MCAPRITRLDQGSQSDYIRGPELSALPFLCKIHAWFMAHPKFSQSTQRAQRIQELTANAASGVLLCALCVLCEKLFFMGRASGILSKLTALDGNLHSIHPCRLAARRKRGMSLRVPAGME